MIKTNRLFKSKNPLVINKGDNVLADADISDMNPKENKVMLCNFIVHTRVIGLRNFNIFVLYIKLQL